MEVTGHRKGKTEVDPWYTKIHEGDGNTERRISALPNNLGNENSNMGRKCQKKYIMHSIYIHVEMKRVLSCLQC